MDPRDVSPYEMSKLVNMSDGELEALCAGQVPSGDERLEGIAGFLKDFAEVHPEPSTEPYEADHLVAMFEAARLMTEKGDPAAMPASKAYGPAAQASGLPKSERETMLSKLRTMPLYTKIASGFAAFLILFSGVAAAGAFPGPVQHAVAQGAAVVGIDLPDGANQAADLGIDTEADEADPNLADEDPRVDTEADQSQSDPGSHEAQSVDVDEN